MNDSRGSRPCGAPCKSKSASRLLIILTDLADKASTMSSNLALLTQAHTAIAAKRRARKTQIAEIVFDDDARRDFLTGFHKRKLAKAEAARSKAKEREKQEHLEIRREVRLLWSRIIRHQLSVSIAALSANKHWKTRHGSKRHMQSSQVSWLLPFRKFQIFARPRRR